MVESTKIQGGLSDPWSSLLITCFAVTTSPAGDGSSHWAGTVLGRCQAGIQATTGQESCSAEQDPYSRPRWIHFEPDLWFGQKNHPKPLVDLNWWFNIIHDIIYNIIWASWMSKELTPTRMVIFLQGIFFLKTMMFHDVKNVLNKRKHHTMVIRSVSLILGWKDWQCLTALHYAIPFGLD